METPPGFTPGSDVSDAGRPTRDRLAPRESGGASWCRDHGLEDA